MKDVKVKRSTVIKALMTEPNLWWGSFASAANCKVCAIGAIVRAAGITPCRVNYIDLCQHRYNSDDFYQLKNILEQGNFFGALSVYHERQCGETRPFTKNGKIKIAHRRKLCAFVLKHFPKELVIPGSFLYSSTSG